MPRTPATDADRGHIRLGEETLAKFEVPVWEHEVESAS
jgi:hypothetical protein